MRAVTGNFPVSRPRRLRSSAALRDLVAETQLDVRSLVAPLFVREGIDELAEGLADLTSIVKSMAAVTDTARKGAEKVALISESARQQLAGSEDMVKAIGQISQVAEANAAATEASGQVMDEQTAAVARMTSAAQELQNLSAELQDVVSRFRLGR